MYVHCLETTFLFLFIATRFPIADLYSLQLCGVFSSTGSSSLISSRFPDSQIIARSSFSRYIGYAMDYGVRSLYTVAGPLRHLT